MKKEQKMENKHIRFLSDAESYIQEYNKAGNEGEIIRFGHRIDKYDLDIQERYIRMLCESDYPITAAMTVKSMHHHGVDKLKELLLRNLDFFQESLFDKIITLIYLNNYKKIIGILNEIEDMEILHIAIRDSLKFLVDQSEYKYKHIFELLYAVTKSKHSSALYHHFTYIKTFEIYIRQNFDIIQESIQTLYKKKEYDSVFYLCKNYKLLQSLKDVLQRDPKELEKEFLDLNTINGIRLAFRILQREESNDEKAYEIIISKIGNMNKTDDIQYIYFCYLLKLIKYQGRVSEDIKNQLRSIGEVKLLKSKIYAINLLAESLEIILINEGMQAYNEFIQVLGVNHIFRYTEEIPNVIPHSIYKRLSSESISSRKEKLKNIINAESLSKEKLITFYMNSFYKYLLAIDDFFSILTGKREDRLPLDVKLKEYIFYGEILSINREDGIAWAGFQNVASSNKLRLTKRHLGRINFEILEERDMFSCSMKRYDPEKGFLDINKFKFVDPDKTNKYENISNSNWNTLKDCFKEIILKEELTAENIDKIQGVSYIGFEKLKLVDEYTDLYSQVLYSLKDKPKEITDFIDAIDFNDNNIFNVSKRNNNFLQINKTEELAKIAEQTINTLINDNLKNEDLIFIYLNSYLRLVINIQEILKSIMGPNEQILELDSLFGGYRFYGVLRNMTTDRIGRKLGYINTRSLKSSRNMSFFIHSEQSVSEEMFESRYKNMITFRLKEYAKNRNYLEIEDVWVQTKNTWIRNWGNIYSCHYQMKSTGTVKIEVLDELRKLPSLDYEKIDLDRFLEGFTWCMNNFCYKKDTLFNYINALHKNNPFMYSAQKNYNTTRIISKVQDSNQSKEILLQLINNNYNLYKIIWVYLNSYLIYDLSLDYVIRQYYSYNQPRKKSEIYYLTELTRIEFMASIEEINEEMVFMNLTSLDCNSLLFLRLSDMNYDINKLHVGQEVKIILVEYHKNKNMICVELS